jgi:hypothetical protein
MNMNLLNPLDDIESRMIREHLQATKGLADYVRATPIPADLMAPPPIDVLPAGMLAPADLSEFYKLGKAK